MVAVLKLNGSVRVCVDLLQLNQGVKREVHPVFSVNESLAKSEQSKMFSIVGSCRCHLTKNQDTPYGWVCFDRVPFGICSAPKVYQRAMSNILEGIVESYVT